MSKKQANSLPKLKTIAGQSNFTCISCGKIRFDILSESISTEHILCTSVSGKTTDTDTRNQILQCTVENARQSNGVKLYDESKALALTNQVLSEAKQRASLKLIVRFNAERIENYKTREMANNKGDSNKFITPSLYAEIQEIKQEIAETPLTEQELKVIRLRQELAQAEQELNESILQEFNAIA